VDTVFIWWTLSSFGGHCLHLVDTVFIWWTLSSFTVICLVFFLLYLCFIKTWFHKIGHATPASLMSYQMCKTWNFLSSL